MKKGCNCCNFLLSSLDFSTHTLDLPGICKALRTSSDNFSFFADDTGDKDRDLASRDRLSGGGDGDREYSRRTFLSSCSSSLGVGEGEEPGETGGEMDGRLVVVLGWGGEGLRSNEASSDPLRGLVRSS